VRRRSRGRPTTGALAARDRALHRLLERIEVPGEHEARERAWSVLVAAFAEREPEPRGRPLLRPAVVLAVVVALVAAALTPPGRAVIESVREAIGVERSQPALFSLPTDGRLLVSSGRGSWIVRADGSKRLLGRYGEATWSPHGLFVAAARRNELVALDAQGELRWSLPRRDVTHPRWAPSGYRVAYLSGSNLRVVAGDGTGDTLLAESVQAVAPAWRPGNAHVLALSDRDGRIHVFGTDRGALTGRSAPGEPPIQLAWSADGNRLLALSARALRVLDSRGRLVERMPAPGGARYAALAVSPHGRGFALVRRRGGRSEILSQGRVVFGGAGDFSDVAWSPDGRWLLVAWKDADQWLFIRSAGVRKVAAVSGISAQFRSEGFPSLGGWCCGD
jgi:WD40 repeat protein